MKKNIKQQRHFRNFYQQEISIVKETSTKALTETHIQQEEAYLKQ